MATPAPLKFVFYIAAPPEKVWEGFVSNESNRILFMGAQLESDWTPGSSIAWTGPGPDGKPVEYVHGKVLQVDAPNTLQYTFVTGNSNLESRVTVELVSETEATQVTVTHGPMEREGFDLLLYRRWLATNLVSPEDSNRNREDV